MPDTTVGIYYMADDLQPFILEWPIYHSFREVQHGTIAKT